eukprot:1196182-Prorocentrum_minimum.AAC.7
MSVDIYRPCNDADVVLPHSQVRSTRASMGTLRAPSSACSKDAQNIGGCTQILGSLGAIGSPYALLPPTLPRGRELQDLKGPPQGCFSGMDSNSQQALLACPHPQATWVGAIQSGDGKEGSKSIVPRALTEAVQAGGL